jgi:hypothetical protein
VRRSDHLKALVRATWLAHANAALDRAVWPTDVSPTAAQEDTILERLPALIERRP